MIGVEECPNGCIDGKIYDPYNKTEVVCQHCLEKRKGKINSISQESKEGRDLKKELNLPDSYLGTNFDYSAVIPESERRLLTEESYRTLGEVLEGLINNATLGVVERYSMIFNFGIKGRDENFIFPYLVRHYIQSSSVCPLMTVPEILRLREEYEDGTYLEKKDTINYQDILKRDVCVVSMDAGTRYSGILAVKGLMQLRAYSNKATIIVTNIWGSIVISNLVEEESEKSLRLATLYGIEYKKSAEKGGSKYASGDLKYREISDILSR